MKTYKIPSCKCTNQTAETEGRCFHDINNRAANGTDGFCSALCDINCYEGCRDVCVSCSEEFHRINDIKQSISNTGHPVWY